MTLRKLAANAARRALRMVGFRSVSRNIRGAPIRIPIAMGDLRSLLFDSNYSPFFNEDDVMDELEKRMRRDDVVFDIGAYHGIWAMLLARHARTVVAFEPNPGTYEVLQETIAVNRAGNVSACPVAIGGASQLADFWGTGSGASLRPGEHKPSRTQVLVETLDDFAARRGTLPDVLKIDVEGAEHQVLTGGPKSLAHARVVCLELHLDELPKFGASSEQVIDLMTRAGFVEVAQSRPIRLGTEDTSRIHLIYERRTSSQPAGQFSSESR